VEHGLGARLRRHVERLAGEIGERHVLRPEALAAAERYVAATLNRFGHEVKRQSDEVQGVDCANLEVTIAGGARAGEIVLAGAHYATVPGSPGVDDNACGVAAILELARLLRGARAARTTRLVAFVNEEPPFFFWGEMCSRVYARAARARGDDIRVMLSLEILGCYSDEKGSQGYPPLLKHFYPQQGDFIVFVSNARSRRMLRRVVAAFCESSGFPPEKLAAPALVPGIGWSDQLSFWREGYPAAMVTDTAFHCYRHYHLPTDTPEKLDDARLAQVVEGLAPTLERPAAGQ
jgi:Zn-dependent M28 family amino/carboxypeptidase